MSKPTNSQQEETDSIEVLELAPEAALLALEKGSIDMQVATAKRYPRSLAKFMKAAKEAVSMDPETAAGCFYKLKRKDKDGTTKFIEGPSVRLLEICASAFQNIRYGARVVGIDAAFVVAQGVAHDVENNVFQSIEVRRRITTSKGHRFGDDMIGVTSNAACSIAKRNALNGVVPRVYVNVLMDLAKDTAIGDAKTLNERRQKAVAHFVEKLGVPVERLYAYLEVKGIEDIGLEHLETLTGLRTAIKEGDTNIDDTFFPKNTETTGPAAASGMFDGADGAKKEAAVKKDPAPAKEEKNADPAPAAAATKEEKPATPPPATEAKTKPAGSQTVHERLEDMLGDAEIPEAILLAFASENGFAPKGATKLTDIPANEAEKFVNAWSGTKNLLKSRMGDGKKGKK